MAAAADIGSGNPKADVLKKKAETTASKWALIKSWEERYNEDAAELYGKAAAQYKISKHWMQAGECYSSAAECSIKAKNEIETNRYWKEAGKMFARVDSALAVEAYGKAIKSCKDRDKFSQAARLHEEIAKILEEEDHIELAIEQYEACVDSFDSDSDETNANKRRLVVAHLSAKLGEYEKALKLFEQVAKHNAENHLLRWNVKELLFKAFLCAINYLCIRDDPKLWESINASYIDRYSGISDLFASSRECKLCVSLGETVPELDLDGFKEAIIKFDSIQRLEPWHNEQILNLEVYITDKKGAAPDLDGPMSSAATSGDGGYEAAAAAAGNPFALPSDGDAAFGVSTTLASADAPDLSSAPEL